MSAKDNTQPVAYLTVRMDQAVYERFRSVVEAEHRTVSQDVRRYVDRRLAEAAESMEPVV